jgi:hypothetical protein
MPVYREIGEPLLYEVVKAQTCSGQPLEVFTATGDSVQIKPANTAGDAFGRLRSVQPFTVFESQHRYQENSKWSTATGVNGTSSYQANESAINLTVTTTSGDYIYRETKRVFPYQPGKSFLTMMSFVFASGKTNLRQRVGMFSTQNGIFFEQSGNTNYMVMRSYVTGSISETRIPQQNWNFDAFNASGVTGRTLDPTKANIFWTDVEWLGVGDVRVGFVVDGRPEIAHVFHGDNVNATTYMTTALLPLRQEIQNLNTTTSSSTAKQICATVISEGGFDPRGSGGTAGHPVTAKYDLTSAGTFYPVASIRLKSTRLDAAVVLAGISLLGTTNNAVYNWQLVAGGTSAAGTWTSAGTNSSVEYNITATGFTQGTGRRLAEGYTVGSNQGSTVTDLTRDDLLKYQLERDPFVPTPYELTLLVATDLAGADVVAAINWEEITE